MCSKSVCALAGLLILLANCKANLQRLEMQDRYDKAYSKGGAHLQRGVHMFEILMSNPYGKKDSCTNVPQNRAEGTFSSCDTPTPFRGSCVGGCGKGYNGSLTATCTSRNGWTVHNQCIPIGCTNSPTNPANGTFGTCKRPTAFQDTCEGDCSSDFTGTLSATCTAPNTWTINNNCVTSDPCSSIQCPVGETCASGVCKCGSGPACSGSTDTCTSGQCLCGANSPCLGSADTCMAGTCKCGSGPACTASADTCTNGMCKCGANAACTGVQTVGGTGGDFPYCTAGSCKGNILTQSVAAGCGILNYNSFKNVGLPQNAPLAATSACASWCYGRPAGTCNSFSVEWYPRGGYWVCLSSADLTPQLQCGLDTTDYGASDWFVVTP